MRHIKIIGVIALIALGLVGLQQFYPSPTQAPIDVLPAQTPALQQNDNQEPQVVSTDPSPLDNIVISPVQVIKITFNTPIENIGEFKHRLEPITTKYDAKLSDDRKTVIISPKENSSYPVGTSFTLFIKSDTKLDGKKTLGKEFIYHFKTISYRGV